MYPKITNNYVNNAHKYQCRSSNVEILMKKWAVANTRCKQTELMTPLWKKTRNEIPRGENGAKGTTIRRVKIPRCKENP